jgi:hypothetical protein
VVQQQLDACNARDLVRFVAVYEVIDGLICNAWFYAAD